MPQLILSSDDYYDTNPLPIRLLEQLKDRYSEFKITLFSVLNKASTYHKYPWITYGFHGLDHLFCECTYWTTEDVEQFIKASEEHVKAHEGVRFAKIFKAPHWELSEEATQYFLDNGWIVCLHNRFPNPHPNVYQGVINPKQISLSKEEIQCVTTHIQDVCGNGLRESHRYLMALPRDTRWHFINDYLLTIHAPVRA